MSEYITTDLSDRVFTIRMTRFEKKNALTGDMYAALAAAVEQAEANPEVRVILLAGSPDCFTSGNDLVDFLQRPPAGDDAPVARFMRALSTARKPVVAAASGIAIGIGVTLLTHCDLVYLGAKTRLNMPFVNIGICPEFASSYLLPRLMGHQRAAELILLGEPFDAAKALEYGLANAVVPNEETEARAREAALRLAAQPPAAMRTSKALLKRWRGDVVQEAIRVEAQHFMPMLTQDEAREAMSAFMEKRKPDFSRFN